MYYNTKLYIKCCIERSLFFITDLEFSALGHYYYYNYYVQMNVKQSKLFIRHTSITQLDTHLPFVTHLPICTGFRYYLVCRRDKQMVSYITDSYNFRVGKISRFGSEHVMLQLLRFKFGKLPSDDTCVLEYLRIPFHNVSV